MVRPKTWFPLLIAGFAAQAGIAGGTPPDTRPTGIAPPTRIPDVLTDAPQPSGEPVAIATLPRDTRRAVAADAARRFGVQPSAVVLTRAEQVTWSDGSLGCPEPGQHYVQVLVPGYRLTARTAAGELVYHADTRGNVKTCTLKGRPPHESLKQRAPAEPVTAPRETRPDR